MRIAPGMVPLALAAGLSLLPGSPAALSVRLEPPGCKPSPPFRFSVRVSPEGPRTCRVEAEVAPSLDARRIAIVLDLPDGVTCLASTASSGVDVRAGDRFAWRAELRLAPGAPGARVLVHALAVLGRPAGEEVSALREIVLGDPLPWIPGRLVRSAGVETVEVPAVPLR